MNFEHIQNLTTLYSINYENGIHFKKFSINPYLIFLLFLFDSYFSCSSLLIIRYFFHSCVYEIGNMAKSVISTCESQLF